MALCNEPGSTEVVDLIEVARDNENRQLLAEQLFKKNQLHFQACELRRLKSGPNDLPPEVEGRGLVDGPCGDVEVAEEGLGGDVELAEEAFAEEQSSN